MQYIYLDITKRPIFDGNGTEALTTSDIAPDGSYVDPLNTWTLKQSSDTGIGMVPLRTTDGFSVCFLVPRKRMLADAPASEGPYEMPIAAS